MAKRNQSGRCPQPQHQGPSQSSQFDKRSRLDQPNEQRERTDQARVPLVGTLATIMGSMSSYLDPRTGFRLPIIIAGIMLAGGRRVASAWFAAAGVRGDWDRFYDCLASVGRFASSMALPLVMVVLRKFAPGPEGHLTMVVDDSPTQRYGAQVEGACVHRDPTPGPAGGDWLYGHNWVSCCLLVPRGMWGVIALPLRSFLYVRQKDVEALTEKYDWKVRTKHELAMDLVLWFVKLARAMGIKCQFRLVADGAYAARKVLVELMGHGIVVLSRLRKDAALFDLPAPIRSGQRGRPRIYGESRLNLAKRAGKKSGWTSLTYICRGQQVTHQYKTFLAATKLTSGVIRVVIVKFQDGGWAPYFCTNPEIEAKEILETVAARCAIEIDQSWYPQSRCFYRCSFCLSVVCFGVMSSKGNGWRHFWGSFRNRRSRFNSSESAKIAQRPLASRILRELTHPTRCQRCIVAIGI
jgi:hypothetical protein